MSAKFIDYVAESNVKYGIGKLVNYSNLITSDFCYSTTLTNCVELNTYFEALKDKNRIQAMNNEIKA